MLNQEPDEPFVRPERGAMNAKRDLIDVVAISVAEVEPARLGKVDLISRDRKLAPDCAPGLHVDFWSVERRFIRHFNKVDPGILQDGARHFFGLPPKLGF